MITTVSFDCFGVLTQEGWATFCDRYATADNLAELNDLSHQVDRGIIAYEDFLSALSELSGAPKAVAHALIASNYTPNEAVFEIIKTLKRTGYQLGVLSNLSHPLRYYLPDECVALFDVVTHSFEVHATKPDPVIYFAHLRELDRKPEEVLFIDDRQHNVDGAAAVGIEGLLFTDAPELVNQLKQQGIKGFH